MIATNKYQTQITDELLDSLEKEVADELIDLITNVPFINRLVSPDRKRAKDLPRDERGRIIVDIVNPHILEDMDYFRPSALHYQKHGCYTKLRPNSNPNSEFGRWLQEEVRRIWDGYVRESDGEWVTGEMYFYLNYSPIILTKYKKGGKKGLRVVDLPKVWEGIYLRFHYWDQARNGGLYNDWKGGNHCAEIAKRGSSKSYCMASTLTKLFLCGENEEARENIRALITAYQKEYLTKDGTLNKFVSMIDFCADYTQFPSKRLKASFQEMTWKLGYIDTITGTNKGLLNEVIGVSSKDDTDKIRGKRSSKIFVEEFGAFPNISEIHRVMIPSVEDGDLVFGQLVYCGTGGSEGSDFSGAMEMMYSPKGYNIYALPNYYDKNSQGKQESIFFFGAYLNREGHYDENGVSDVVGALIAILQNRLLVKYNTSDPSALTRTKAENPCTIQEAIMKRDSTIYPVSELTDVLNELNLDPRSMDTVAVGSLKMDNAGKVTYSPDSDSQPIREFPHKDNKLHGAVELFEMPVIDNKTGKPYSNRYIAGCLTPGELVHTNLGPKKVEEINIDNTLINKDGKEVGINTLIKLYKNNVDIFKFNINSVYKSSTFTEEHPLYVAKAITDTFDFTLAKDVKAGWWTKFPNIYNQEKNIDNTLWDKYNSTLCPTIENPLSKSDFWWFVGLWLGDGFCSKTSNNHTIFMCFGETEDYYNVKYKNVVKQLFNRSACYKSRKYSAALKFESKQLFNFLTDNFGSGATSKHIPEWVKYLPKHLKAQLILGYLDSDGSIFKDGKKIRATFTSVNIKLLQDTQDILFSLGIVSKINLHSKETTYNINGKTGVSKPAYVLQLSQSELIKLVKKFFMKYIEDKKINKTIDFFNTKTPIQRSCVMSKCENFIYLKINKIEKSKYTGYVYNFDCATHTYVTTCVSTHNCDPYDDDASTTLSLGSILVLDTWTDRLVAEYTGRPMFADDFYETCRRLLLFYNAKANYEAHPYDQTVRLPNGTTKLWGDIKIGDKLFTPNGDTTNVIDIPMDGKDDIYSITFSDGRKVKASSGHIWSVYTLNNRKSPKEITTKEMFTCGVVNKFNQIKFFIPKHDAVEYPHQNVDIDPYTLGILIAEGSLTKFRKNKQQLNKRNTVQISSGEEDMNSYKKFIPYPIKYIGTKGYSYHVYIEDIDFKLDKLGLLFKNSHTKFIPKEYLYNDYNTRLELLKGLMDGDGHANKKGGSIYVTVSKQLAEDTMLLIRSLGMFCKLEKNYNSYRIRIAATIPIFKLPRKVQNQYVYFPNKKGSKASGFLNKVGISSIEYIGVERCKCVTVDSTDGLYLIGDYITTHNCNKKGLFSYFSRMNSLYLLTDTLEFLKDKELVKGELYGNKLKGTTSTEPIKKYGRTCIRGWLLKPKSTIVEVDGQEVETSVPQLKFIKNKALLKELILYNADGNFDRHDALSMLMLLREDFLRYCGTESPSERAHFKDKDYLGNDQFFEKNYKSKKSHNDDSWI